MRGDAPHLPLLDASVDAADEVATVEFTAGPARVLTEMARVTWPGGRVAVAVLNRVSPWGWAGRVRRRQPYCHCTVTRDRLLVWGRRHGQATVRRVLFAFERLPALPALGPVFESIGRAMPRLGALQILTIHRGQTT